MVGEIDAAGNRRSAEVLDFRVSIRGPTAPLVCRAGGAPARMPSAAGTNRRATATDFMAGPSSVTTTRGRLWPIGESTHSSTSGHRERLYRSMVPSVAETKSVVLWSWQRDTPRKLRRRNPRGRRAAGGLRHWPSAGLSRPARNVSATPTGPRRSHSEGSSLIASWGQSGSRLHAVVRPAESDELLS